uniref:Integrase catalytic domain-containing protein n=1 Tax=Macaca mulatta TaxID=9544 RepID=A0A5F7ZR07_MACMU
MWMDLSEWSKTVRISVSHVSAYQWVTSAEDFNNQVDRMSPSVHSSQPLSPVTPVIAQWAHEQSGHGGRDGGYIWAQEHGLPLTKADLATATAECPICQQQRPILSPQYGTVPWGDQPATRWHVDDTGPLSSWKGQRFVLTGLNTYSRYGFAYPACNASSKTTIICGLTECLIHCHGIPHSIASDQGTHFMAKEVWQWVHAHGIHWSYHVPHHPEAAGLIEQNGLLKSQLQHQLGDNTLQGWGKVLQKAMYALDQCPIYINSLTARIHRSRNQGVEVAPLIITLRDPLAKFLLPVPTTLHSAGLEVLVSKGGTLPPGNTTVIPLNRKIVNWTLGAPPTFKSTV